MGSEEGLWKQEFLLVNSVFFPVVTLPSYPLILRMPVSDGEVLIAFRKKTDIHGDSMFNLCPNLP